MADVQREMSLEEVRALCTDRNLISSGPLNNTYAGSFMGSRVFIRNRVLINQQYGQTFAAERLLPDWVRTVVKVPKVLQVLKDERGDERFAVFEYVHGATPDWSSSLVLSKLAKTLDSLHEIEGDVYGNLGGPYFDSPAELFVRQLLEDELGRLEGVSAEHAIHGVTDGLLKSADLFRGERPRLCHGDVHSGNWLMDRAGQLWAVDWEAARYRVAAADFNQTHFNWLSKSQQDMLIGAYAHDSGRDEQDFLAQVNVLRVLWHVRTYNFYVLVRREDPRRHLAHLDAAHDVLEGAGVR